MASGEWVDAVAQQTEEKTDVCVCVCANKVECRKEWEIQWSVETIEVKLARAREHTHQMQYQIYALKSLQSTL